jgi:hypothetical protein
MADLPWWGWLIIAIMAVAVFLRIALGTFRRQVRRQFVELLCKQNPDLEVLRLNERSIRLRSSSIGNSEFFFAPLYTAIAELGAEDEQAREPVYRAFLVTLAAQSDPTRS